ncbi:MAG: low molecular weight phosphatase family protein [Hyphomicrobiaceae bacterium]
MAQAGELPGAVLFVCSMNAIRSPIAAALLRHLAGHRTFVRSAGVRAGEPDGFAIAVMDEIGLDISKHRPHTIDELEDISFDLIVTLAPEAHHRALELTRTVAVDVEYWPTMDPSLRAGQGSREDVLAEYRRVRDSLLLVMKRRFRIEGGPTV